MSLDLSQYHFHSTLEESDPAVAHAIAGELDRQRSQIELIASENLVSQAVLQAQGSVMTNKTVEGYPGHRYYGGAQHADVIESLAIERACALFNCQFANVQPHSGSNANQAVYLACLRPGDTIVSMNTSAGGHISHGHPATLTGRVYNIVSYGLTPHDEFIDYEEVSRLASEHTPKLIIAGGSAYSRSIDFARFGEIAHQHNALLLVDMAHFAGLVATGLHPHPFPHADIVTTTTYKSLRGARGGMILWNDNKLTQRLNNAVFPGIQGSVLLHGVAGKAVCLKEAGTEDFVEYNKAVIANAKTLAQGLTTAGIRIVSGGTDTGLMLVDLRSLSITGADAVDALENAGLTCNKNQIPNDPLPAETASGLRLSVNAGTARGFGSADFERIAGWIAKVLTALADTAANAPADTIKDPVKDPVLESVINSVRNDVENLCAAYPIYG